MSNDPVFEKEDEWHFWDEAWVECYGPFETEKEARDELEKYCEQLNRHPIDDKEAKDIQVVKAALEEIQKTAFTQGFTLGMEEQRVRTFMGKERERVDMEVEEYWSKYTNKGEWQ